MTRDGLLEILDKLCIRVNSLKDYEGVVVFVGFVKTNIVGNKVDDNFTHGFYRYNFDIVHLPLYALILNKIVENEIKDKLKR